MLAGRKALFPCMVFAVIFALVPLFTKRNDLINLLVLIFLYIALAQSGISSPAIPGRSVWATPPSSDSELLQHVFCGCGEPHCHSPS